MRDIHALMVFNETKQKCVVLLLQEKFVNFLFFFFELNELTLKLFLLKMKQQQCAYREKKIKNLFYLIQRQYCKQSDKNCFFFIRKGEFFYEIHPIPRKNCDYTIIHTTSKKEFTKKKLSKHIDCLNKLESVC